MHRVGRKCYILNKIHRESYFFYRFLAVTPRPGFVLDFEFEKLFGDEKIATAPKSDSDVNLARSCKNFHRSKSSLA